MLEFVFTFRKQHCCKELGTIVCEKAVDISFFVFARYKEIRMEQIGNRKKQGSIVEILRDAILSGRIPEDTEMTQNELAQDLGVSRMPVREALILLEYQGLIRRLPNNHVRVVRLSQSYFEHLFSLCAKLESVALCGWAMTDELPVDELDFHRCIYREYPFEMQKKILESITEIYIYYVINCGSYDRKSGKKYLAEIRKTAKEKDVERTIQEYQKYFRNLTNAMIKEREEN